MGSAERKDVTMAKKSSPSSIAMAGTTPLPSTIGSTLQWDASTGVCQEAEIPTFLGSSSFFQAKEPPAIESDVNSYWTTSEIGLVPGASPQSIVWEQEAARATFSLAPVLLADTHSSVLTGTTGELVWVPWPEQTTSLLPAVRPVLFVHTLHETSHTERLTIVPSFSSSDPLFHHLTLLLQTAFESESVTTQLYTQSLTDALAVHFLRRYGTTRRPLGEGNGGLSPYKLRRTTAYINAHLEQELSLATLAAVGETSPAHFSRLFKHATGLAPHQYVIMCRMERAKHLLAETDISLTEISLLVGCTDHSHFSALFRTHVAQTPTAYRDQTRR
jgi:AraC-like DNA-binding protein